MTCIEKLRELYPELDDGRITIKILSSCPSDIVPIDFPKKCPRTSNEAATNISKYCRECWNREFIDPIPHEFEFIQRNEIVYDAVNRIVEETKMHMTVLERVKQHYTGKLVYKIRRQSEEGWIDEGFYTEKEVGEILAARIR